jgi:hypothetical protein
MNRARPHRVRRCNRSHLDVQRRRSRRSQRNSIWAALVDQCYRNGRYESLDYRADPEPPLGESDADWANELLRRKGLR